MISDEELGQKLRRALALQGLDLTPGEVAERVRYFLAVAQSVDLPDSSDIFSLLILFEAYRATGEVESRKLAANFKAMAKEAVKMAEAEGKRSVENARAEMIQASAEVQKEMSKAVYNTSDKVAKDVAGRRFAQWIAGAVAVSALAVAGLGWAFHSISYKTGYEAAAAELKKETSFLESAAGRKVQKLEKSGELQDLLKFYESASGKKVMALYEEGRLNDILGFLESLAGQAALVYPNDTLEKILFCQQGEDWKVVLQQDGRNACFPAGGFYIPAAIHLPEKAKKKSMDGISGIKMKK